MDLTKPIGNDPKFHVGLRKFRESLDKTPAEFAEMLGVSDATIYGWESEFGFRPGPKNREKLLKLMGKTTPAKTTKAPPSPSAARSVGQVLADHKRLISQELGIPLAQVKIVVEF